MTPSNLSNTKKGFDDSGKRFFDKLPPSLYPIVAAALFVISCLFFAAKRDYSRLKADIEVKNNECAAQLERQKSNYAVTIKAYEGQIQDLKVEQRELFKTVLKNN
jgi:hypothetical protein